MSLIDVAKTIGDDLTQIDTTLQTPGIPDPQWQALYALRKHLNDIQCELIEESIDEGDPAYETLTAQLKAASVQLSAVLKDLTEVGTIISTVSQIAAYADQLLKLAV
jgi:hypothetical protein